MDDERQITKISVLGGSGKVPTGALQFMGDCPGLFVRGEDAIILASAVEQLQVRLAGHPDSVVAMSLVQIQQYAEIIARNVVVR